jgi:catechol 2,3-dioxygenase-like lactoylglutathione lyase family enzyme
MDTVNVRYIVNDVDAAIEFYRDALGFTVDMHPAPGFAALSRGALQLFLNVPGAGGAGQSMPDGSTPAPGGKVTPTVLGTDDRPRRTWLPTLRGSAAPAGTDRLT